VKVMFDTNVFSNLSNHFIDPKAVPTTWEPVATHIQWDEIQRTRDPVRRGEIVAVFVGHLTEKVATSSAVWDVSILDGAEWTGPNSAYESILQLMNDLKPDRNNPADALIADTCLQKGFILVTNDGTLTAAARASGIQVTNLQEPAPK